MRKDAVLDFVKEKTRKLISSGEYKEGADALEIALALKLDRANVSKELNRLWKDGKLVKINERPVLFLDINLLQAAFPYSYIPSIINKGDKLTDYLANKTSKTSSTTKLASKDNLDKMIGSDGSLKLQIEHAKAAISYPPHGLHTLIVGNPGSGKLMFSYYMMDYAIAHNQKDKTSKFLRINCQQYRDNSDDFLTVLVGRKNTTDDNNKQGLFDKTNGGILYFDNVHLLSNESLDIILGILERNQYSKIGDNRLLNLGCTIILSCNNTDYKNIDLLERVVPLTIKLPDIDNYLPYEKVELILDALAKEAKSSNQVIRAHKDIIILLSSMSYKQNLTELRNKIKLICSKAYLDTINKNNSIVNISFSHLPNEVLEKKEKINYSNNAYNRILSIIEEEYIYFNEDGYCEALNKLINAPDEFSVHRASQFLNELRSNIDDIENVDSYIQENISCMQYCGNAQLEAVKNSINPIVEQVVVKHLSNTSWFKQTDNSYKLLYGVMLHASDSLFRSGIINNDEIFNNIKVKSETSEEYLISYKVYQELASIFKISFSEKDYDFFAMYISILKQWFIASSFLLLFVAHGESVARQYADYARALDDNIYIEYIDIDGDLQLNDILELACSKVAKYDNCSGVLLLSDGLSLRSMGDYILKEIGIRCKTLYPISYDLISNVIDKCRNKLVSLDSFENKPIVPEKDKVIEENKELISPFIDRLNKNFISKSVTFIDTNKAITLLNDSLLNILSDLNIVYSDEIGVKFFCHSVHMLERSISKDSLTYEGMKSFIDKNKKIFEVVENRMKPVNQAYGTQIPLSELCFLSEIFIDL